MIKTTRRGFMVGCSAAIAAMAGARLGYAAFGSAEDEPNQDIMVVVFLRGGCDAMSLVAPTGGTDRGLYVTARPNLALPNSGPNALLQLGGNPFGLHPNAGGLHSLYNAGNLAIIQATGMHSDTRSHFDAMAYMELGTPNDKSRTTGWLTRHLQSAENVPDEISFPAMTAGSLRPTSLVGNFQAVSVDNIDLFNLQTGAWGYFNEQRVALRNIYSSDSSPIHQAGQRVLEAVDVVEDNVTGAYTPANGAVYPEGEFSEQLQLIARMIKLQLGLRVATVDLGGWDTHEYQAAWQDPMGGIFGGLVTELSSALSAFYQDLDGGGTQNYAQRTTVIIMSEFGRRLDENDNFGTDHGHGGIMLLLGGQVNGGLYGQWPGLHTEQLYDRADLAVTTDYRRVLSEILIRRMGNPNLGTVFPGYMGYTPLNVVQGVDLTPQYESNLTQLFVPMVGR